MKIREFLLGQPGTTLEITIERPGKKNNSLKSYQRRSENKRRPLFWDVKG